MSVVALDGVSWNKDPGEMRLPELRDIPVSVRVGSASAEVSNEDPESCFDIPEACLLLVSCVPVCVLSK